MIVFRVENVGGWGPYHANTSISMMINGYHAKDWDRWPNPYYDTGNLGDKKAKEYQFGFKSFRQFWDWFGDYQTIRLLKQSDSEFYLTTYEVSEECVVEGGKQIKFDKKASKLLKRIRI